ncbi:MAG TPA: DUF4147 domain-containing protein [Kofleriaceae bacterium]|nr:DUF4147 domain-containing protein [Kofleriaceae bacterium]
MTLDRATAEAVFREVVVRCDPAALVAAQRAMIAERAIGIAVGKAALAMARGFGPVLRGIAVVPRGGAGEAPAGWQVVEAAHPVPDVTSVAAGRAIAALVDAADAPVACLISGGASALIEQPALPLPDFVATVSAVAAAGAPIHELNVVRGALSALKAGRLALRCRMPIVTLAISDVIGDDLATIGSGPTIGPWLDRAQAVDVGLYHEALRVEAVAILERHAIAVPAVLAQPIAAELVTRTDRAILLASLAYAAERAVETLAARGLAARLVRAPMHGEPAAIAELLAAEPGSIVAWGEPTLRLPADRGEGGRAQQLALELARRIGGTARTAFVVGTDGVDGPPPHGRPAPAGAFVDGTTWDRIADPERALARCDAGPALAAIGALVVTGPTGINHADLAIVA